MANGGHDAATVISDAFKNKSRLYQHQLVCDPIKGDRPMLRNFLRQVQNVATIE